MPNLIYGIIKKGTRTYYEGRKGIKKCISIMLCASIVVTGFFCGTSFANDVSENEHDIYTQGLIEKIDIEGVTYIYKHYYDENGNRSVSITDENSSKEEVLTYDEKSSAIYLNNEKIGDVKSSEDSEDNEQNLKSARVDTRWRLINGPVHKYISWAKGTTTAIVAGSIATFLGFKTKAVISAIGFGGLSVLAASCSGGTLHFSKYYRNLAFGQTQYRTDWSFVASTGDRYGTYTYLSTPQ